MKRRVPRSPQQKSSSHHPHSASPCRALVRVDGTAIREKIKLDYEKAKRDLANSQRQLEQFHKTDVPQFTRWLNTHFGALLTELRELSQKLAADEALVFQVENEAFFGGGSLVNAYKRVMRARENPEPQPPPPDGDGEADREREASGARPEFDDYDELDDSMDAFFEQFFGGPGSGPGERPREHQGLWDEPARGPMAPAHASAPLKELYRALVRRLHPDTQQEMTPQKAEWWHQAQTAYQAGDVEQLEVILTLCEIGDSGTTAQTSASLLQRITAQMKSSLRQLKRELGERKRDPAWGFSRRADPEVLELQMRRTLTGELRALQDRWRETRKLIDGWQRAVERGKKPRKQKTQAQGMEFPF